MLLFEVIQHNAVGYYLVRNVVWNINDVAELVYD